MQAQSRLVQQSRAVGLAGQEAAKLREAIQGLAKSGVSAVKEADRASLGSLKANDTPVKQQANDNQAQMRQLGKEQSQGRGR